MSCPNCGEQMKPIVKDNQTLLHCNNCGACFFEDNGINRITPESAASLAELRYQQHLQTVAALKKCPRDQSIMAPVINSDAVPRNVTLYHCATCNGIFTSADDLVHFKKAQHVKVDYYRIWEMPLPRLQSVLVVLMIALLSGSIYIGVSSINQNISYKSQAADIVKTIQFTKSGRYFFVAFRTQTPFKSQIYFNDQTKVQTIVKPVSQDFTTTHFATFTQFDNNDSIYFHVTLTDRNGNTIQTAETKLEFGR